MHDTARVEYSLGEGETRKSRERSVSVLLKRICCASDALAAGTSCIRLNFLRTTSSVRA